MLVGKDAFFWKSLGIGLGVIFVVYIGILSVVFFRKTKTVHSVVLFIVFSIVLVVAEYFAYRFLHKNGISNEMIGIICGTPLALASGVLASKIYDVNSKKEKILSRLNEMFSNRENDSAPPKTAHNLPRDSSIFFTGRDAFLKEILRTLEEKQAVALTGAPGIGKTRAALEYGYQQHRAKKYRYVFWVIADNVTSLMTGLLDIARELNLPEQDSEDQGITLRAVQNWLKQNTEYLLILDNVENLRILSDFLPGGCTGHRLLTERDPSAGNFFSLKVGLLTPDDAAMLLLRRSKTIEPDGKWEDATESQQEAARRLAGELGCLPLALDQAGAYIHETPGEGFKEYLHRYHEKGADLRKRRGDTATDHVDSVFITFWLAFEKVQKAEKNGPAAADILRLCSFLHPDDIPPEIFTEGIPQIEDDGFPLLASLKEDPGSFPAILREVTRYSLIQHNGKDNPLTIHRVTQDVLRDIIPKAEHRRWKERAVKSVVNIFPDGFRYENHAQCERLLAQAAMAEQHIETEDFSFQEAGLLLNNHAGYLKRFAQYADAEPLYECALAIREKALGPEHPYVAAILNNLAELYRAQGRSADAEPLYERALTIFEKALGPDHPYVAITLDNLAGLYPAQGRYADAEPLYERALAIREKALGPDHPDVAVTLNNLAELYRAQGCYAEAEPLYERDLAITEKALDPDHPDVAVTLNNLALLYHAQGRYVDAEPLYQRALAIYEKALGPEHPDVAATLENYAVLLKKTGRRAEAEKMEERARNIRSKNG